MRRQWILQDIRKLELYGTYQKEMLRNNVVPPHTFLPSAGACALGSALCPHGVKQGRGPSRQAAQGFPGRPPGARGRPRGATRFVPPRGPSPGAAAGKSDCAVPLALLKRPPGLAAAMEDEEGADEQQQFSYQQRLKAAVHYTVGCLCEEVASDKEVSFSKQTIAAISEVTFRQCENFAKDLEMFARHAKRSTINTEDVKLLARRSNSLLRYITEKNEEIAQGNQERKAKKKKKLEDENNSVEPAEADVEESET